MRHSVLGRLDSATQSPIVIILPMFEMSAQVHVHNPPDGTHSHDPQQQLQ